MQNHGCCFGSRCGFSTTGRDRSLQCTYEFELKKNGKPVAGFEADLEVHFCSSGCWADFINQATDGKTVKACLLKNVIEAHKRWLEQECQSILPLTKPNAPETPPRGTGRDSERIGTTICIPVIPLGAEDQALAKLIFRPTFIASFSDLFETSPSAEKLLRCIQKSLT